MDNRAIERQVVANHEAVERACELMLVTPGNYGVLVTILADATVRAELTHDVPFGEVHYRQAERWNGVSQNG